MHDGVVIDVDPNDHDGRILWLFGTNDFKVTRTVNAFLKVDDLFLDIGSNHSTIGFSARHKVGRKGHVHFFEPQPKLAETIQKAIDRAGVSDRMKLHRVALYDIDGSMELFIPSRHSGMATLTERGKDFLDQSAVSVPVRRTRDYLSEIVEGRPFGVKIDVEGAELKILPDLFEFPGYRFCLFEGSSETEALYDLFDERGWTIFGLCKTVLRPKLSRITGYKDWNSYHDFIALPTNPIVEDGPQPLRKIARAFRKV